MFSGKDEAKSSIAAFAMKMRAETRHMHVAYIQCLAAKLPFFNSSSVTSSDKLSPVLMGFTSRQHARMPVNFAEYETLTIFSSSDVTGKHIRR